MPWYVALNLRPNEIDLSDILPHTEFFAVYFTFVQRSTPPPPTGVANPVVIMESLRICKIKMQCILG